MKTAFFVSTGRTGTDFFSTLFNDIIKNSWSLHEPKPAFRKRGHELMSRDHTLYEKYYFSLPRKFRHRRHAEKWYVETNYHLFAAIPLIRDAFPDALVFHIVRDGRDVVTSWLNRFRYITNDHMTPFHVPGDTAQARWDKWNPLQKLSWYWKTVNLRAKNTEPDMILRFEDLFIRNRDLIFDILKRFDKIEYDTEQIKGTLNKRINLNKNDFFPKYDEWPRLWKDQFWEIAGQEMEAFNYSCDL
ncbi:MAG: sulfotransferase [Deltaproteobacteria bacterium]|nr:sulfotransferase [Deltaproteobacteria bacterium]